MSFIHLNSSRQSPYNIALAVNSALNLVMGQLCERWGLPAYELVSRSSLWQAAQLEAQEKDFEEEMRVREAALDEAMDARAIRGEALGQDRHFRRYWWYPGIVLYLDISNGFEV